MEKNVNKKLTIQQPKWDDEKQFQLIIEQIKSYPNLVSTNEIRVLKKQLSQVAQGDGFVIQGGDCAETFVDFNTQNIKNKLKVLLQMSAIIQYITKVNVVKIGRIAGQFFKPRTHEFETRKNLTLPSYRGDAINSIKFTEEDRKPNPKRLLQAYHQSAATMNLIRNLTMRGFTNFQNIKSWELSNLEKSRYFKKYNDIANHINEIFHFTNQNNISNNLSNTVFTSHEALLLDYETAFLNKEESKIFNCSAHMVWVGDRTRFLDSAHIEFVSRIENPIGIKIGPSFNINDISFLCKKINPENKYGKISFIVRLGINYINQLLPLIIKEVQKNHLNVLWLCDPMHGNTTITKTGYKTRNFDTVKDEIECFFKIHEQHNTTPGGLHFELTGDNVTECTGGINNIKDADLQQYYQTACDPRLNNEQSLEMGFLIAELLEQRKKNE